MLSFKLTYHVIAVGKSVESTEFCAICINVFIYIYTIIYIQICLYIYIYVMILFHTPTVVCAVCNCCVFFRIKACACICCYVESTSVSQLTSVTMTVSRRQEWERRNPRTMIQEVQIGDLIWSTVHVSKSSHTTKGCHVAYRFIIQSWFSYLNIDINIHIHL